MMCFGGFYCSPSLTINFKKSLFTPSSVYRTRDSSPLGVKKTDSYGLLISGCSPGHGALSSVSSGCNADHAVL